MAGVCSVKTNALANRIAQNKVESRRRRAEKAKIKNIQQAKESRIQTELDLLDIGAMAWLDYKIENGNITEFRYCPDMLSLSLIQSDISIFITQFTTYKNELQFKFTVDDIKDDDIRTRVKEVFDNDKEKYGIEQVWNKMLAKCRAQEFAYFKETR